MSELPKPTLRCKLLALLLSRRDREEIVAVLENAKQRLWDGREVPFPDGKIDCICFAIERTKFPYITGYPAEVASSRIRRTIHRRLGFGVGNLARWLRERDRDAGQPIPASTVTVQALRLQWINELIKEYAP